MPGMTRSRIGYTDPDDPRPIYGWNPGGMGCSNGCGGCWARKLSNRLKGQIDKCGGATVLADGVHYTKCISGERVWRVCRACAGFEVHLHRDRLNQPLATRKPGVVLCNFTCDTFDAKRPGADVTKILDAAARASHHTYVWLTKNAKRMADASRRYTLAGYDHHNWYLGLTIRDQADADAKLPGFLGLPGKLWISYEPARGGVEWVFGDDAEAVCAMCVHPDRCRPLLAYPMYGRGLWRPCAARTAAESSLPIAGIILGHDNRKGGLGTDTLDHIRDCVKQCKAAGVNVYVKQLWIDGKLRHDPADFPEDLRQRDLPWQETD